MYNDSYSDCKKNSKNMNKEQYLYSPEVNDSYVLIEEEVQNVLLMDLAKVRTKLCVFIVIHHKF